MALVTGSLHLLTQFINSHELRLLFTTFRILELKNNLLVSFTTFLNFFQLFKLLDTLYLLMACLHSLFHHCLKCLMILICFVFLFHTWLISKLRIFLRHSLLLMLRVFRFLKTEMTSLINAVSCLLFCWIKSFKVLIVSSTIGMVIDKGVWSDVSHQLGWIEYWFSSVDPYLRNIKSMVKFAFPTVSEYLVG